MGGSRLFLFFFAGAAVLLLALVPVTTGESTEGYHHVLGLPGHETVAGGPRDTTAPPPDAPHPSQATYGFAAVLPVPRVTPSPPAKRDPLDAPGAAVGRYRLGGRLSARSGYAVHAALHPIHGECRVMVLDPDTARERGSAFLIEARLLATISHPALLPVLESGAEPRPWVAQPLSPGVTLEDALAREGPWAVERTRELLCELAGGLARVHGAGLVHGDLDPAQVVLPPAGGVRLLGLGSPALVGDLGDRQAWAGGESLGAAPYAAPEVQSGSRADARADVWALGLLGLQCLTGRPAFTGNSPREVQLAVLAGAPPRDAWPPVPAGLGDALARCLQADPAARFADAGELLGALLRRGAAGGTRPGMGVAALVALGLLVIGLVVYLAARG